MTETIKLTEEQKELIREEKRRYQRKYYEQNKKELREKHREWRNKNPDKVKAYNARHWLKKAEQKQG